MTRKLSLALVLCAFVTVQSWAQYRQNDEKYVAQGVQEFDDPARVSPNRRLESHAGNSGIVLEWGAPSVRGRRVTGGLVSTYKVWRTGANEATIIHFSEDVLIEGEALDAGTYALFTIGGKKKWTFIFNNEAQQWGAFTYDRKEDALRVKVEPGSGEHTEQLTFEVEESVDREAVVHLRWGDIAVQFHVAFVENS